MLDSPFGCSIYYYISGQYSQWTPSETVIKKSNSNNMVPYPKDEDSSNISDDSSESSEESEAQQDDDDPEAAKARLRAKIRAQAGSLLNSKVAPKAARPPASIKMSTPKTEDPPANKSSLRKSATSSTASGGAAGSVDGPPPLKSMDIDTSNMDQISKDDESAQNPNLQKTGQQSQEIPTPAEESESSLIETDESRKSTPSVRFKEAASKKEEAKKPEEEDSSESEEKKNTTPKRGNLAEFKSGGEDPNAAEDGMNFLEIEEEVCPAGAKAGLVLCILFVICWIIVVPVAVVTKQDNIMPVEIEEPVAPVYPVTVPPTAVGGVGVGVTVAPGVNGSTPVSPTGTPTLLFDLPAYTQQALADPSSPQSLVLDWMYSDPQLLTYTPERQMQRYALAAFYFATGGANWTDSSNWLDLNSDIHECFWYAQVPVCNNQQQYTILELNENNLVGVIPPELSMLTTLNELHLRGNSIQGEIPVPALTSFTNMTWLDLQDNEMTGTFPSELGLMTMMDFLWLNGTRASDAPLSVTIPTELALLTDLQELHMAENKLYGRIPTELAGLSRLDWISLRGNALSGQIPTEMFLLPSLARLDLAGNALNGNIPDDISLLNVTLQILQLESNSFTGAIPNSMSRLTNVEAVWLGDNSLTGNVPVGLCYFKRIGKVQSIWIDCEEVECACSCDCYVAPVVLETAAPVFAPDTVQGVGNSTVQAPLQPGAGNSTVQAPLQPVQPAMGNNTMEAQLQPVATQAPVLPGAGNVTQVAPVQPVATVQPAATVQPVAAFPTPNATRLRG